MNIWRDDFSTASGPTRPEGPADRAAGSPSRPGAWAGGANLPPPFPPYTAADAWEDMAARAPVVLMAAGVAGLVVWFGAWAGGLVR